MILKCLLLEKHTKKKTHQLPRAVRIKTSDPNTDQARRNESQDFLGMGWAFDFWGAKLLTDEKRIFFFILCIIIFLNFYEKRIQMVKYFSNIIYFKETDEIELTWESKPGRTYLLLYDTTLGSWDADIDDSIESGGESTTLRFQNPEGPEVKSIFFKVIEN